MAPDNNPHKVFRIGPFEVDSGQRQLRHDGAPVAVEPRAFDLLLFLIGNSDRVVEKDEILDAVWPGQIVSETALTRCIMKARRALGDDSSRQSVIRTVHGHGYQLVADVRSVADEPGRGQAPPGGQGPGEKPPPEDTRAGQAPSIAAAEPKRPSLASGIGITLTGATLILTLALIWSLTRMTGQPPGTTRTAGDLKSIAVLPFENRSSGADEESFFADGVHDDLLTLLAGIEDLKVISRTSVQRYRGSDRTIPQIAAELGVATVLEGGVQRAGDRVRINVQLIDGQSDLHLWAETYDRELTAGNVFEIQSEIAAVVASELAAQLSPRESQALNAVPTENLDALFAYQRGRQAFFETTAASLLAAKAHFESAIDLDPGFASAWAGLAYTYIYLPTFGAMSSDEGYPRARDAVQSALALNPQHGEAHAALAIVESRDNLSSGGLDSLARALELNPNSSLILVSYSQALKRLGRAPEALALDQKAVALDPLWTLAWLVYGDTLEAMGEFDRALAEYHHAAELDPESQRGYSSVGDMHYELGQFVPAVRWTRKALSFGPREPWLYGRLARMFIDLGELDAAQDMIDRTIALSPDGALTHFTLAYFYLRAGDSDRGRFHAQNLRGRLRGDGLQMLRVLDIGDGRASDALARYARAYPALFSEQLPAIGWQNYRAAIDIGSLLVEAGELRQATAMLDAASAAIVNKPVMGQYGKALAAAEILALKGERDAAIAQLRAAVDEGWRMRWWLWTRLNPNFNSLRDDPEFIRIVALLQADIEAQLKDVRALLDSGELEPLLPIESLTGD